MTAREVHELTEQLDGWRLRASDETRALLDRLARLDEMQRQAEALRRDGYYQAQIAPGRTT